MSQVTNIKLHKKFQVTTTQSLRGNPRNNEKHSCIYGKIVKFSVFALPLLRWISTNLVLVRIYEFMTL